MHSNRTVTTSNIENKLNDSWKFKKEKNFFFLFDEKSVIHDNYSKNKEEYRIQLFIRTILPASICFSL